MTCKKGSSGFPFAAVRGRVGAWMHITQFHLEERLWFLFNRLTEPSQKEQPLRKATGVLPDTRYH